MTVETSDLIWGRTCVFRKESARLHWGHGSSVLLLAGVLLGAERGVRGEGPAAGFWLWLSARCAWCAGCLGPWGGAGVGGTSVTLGPWGGAATRRQF